jgi:phosphoribosylanthranilate isomerase
MTQLFRIKICGITNVADARAALDAGADAIGLNFYPESPRYVAPGVACSIAEGVGRQLSVVGVFVNADAKLIRETVQAVPLAAVQLHGDESPELVAELGDLPTIRALRPKHDFAELEKFVRRCRELHAEPRMVLIDAWNAQAFGGTGDRADWSLIAANRSILSPLPLVLAGGLTAANVATAIEQVRPDAVDTASGVETAPGQKSPDKIIAFVKEARQAFAGLRSNG